MDIFAILLACAHVLIGGRTGAGKSVLLNGLIYTAFLRPVNRVQMVFIDPKRVELCQYRYTKQCLIYASEPDQMVLALQNVLKIMELRYKTMQMQKIKKSHDPDLYVFIDELADLVDTGGKPVIYTLKRILQLGRAANVHIVACTQHVSRRILPASLQINFDGIAALPQRSRIESRQMIGASGAEMLDIGTCYYMTSSQHIPKIARIPMVSDTDIQIAIHDPIDSVGPGDRAHSRDRLWDRIVRWCDRHDIPLY